MKQRPDTERSPVRPTPSGWASSRRTFLKASTGAVIGLPWLSSSGWAAGSANGKLSHACIGVGGMGWGDLQNFLGHPQCQVTALCDVDANHLRRAAQAVPGARTYADWRELLEKEADRIDSVNVTVPDHMHFVIAWAAIQKGKHVYCQKPMCHDVAEVRELSRAAAQAGVVTQLGTQAASGAGDRTAVELLQKGAVGPIRRAVLCSNRPGAIDTYRLKGPRPAHGQPPPPHLRWDLWLGTAPVRPFVPEIYHPVRWRAWLDFGTGWSGDIGCHIFDAVWKGLSMKPPLSVRAEVQESWKNSPARRADTWPQGDHISWIFPGNSLTEGKELLLDWYDGEFYPPTGIRSLYFDPNYPPESAMLVGTEGALLLPHGSMPILLPLEKFRNYPRPAITSRNHYHHFVDACLGSEATESHFSQTGPMTEAILLGTVAIRVPGQTLEWDSAAMKIPNVPEAENLLRRTYREGWRTAQV